MVDTNLEVRTTEIFDDWFDRLKDRRAKARIQARIDRVELGSFGDIAPVGNGVHELRFFSGPGYRVYLVQKRPNIVILLSGGTKSGQVSDIRMAKRIAKLLEE